MSEAEVIRIFETAEFLPYLKKILLYDTENALKRFKLSQEEIDAIKIASDIVKDPEIAEDERYSTLVRRACDILRIEWRDGFTLTRRGPSKLV